MQAKTAAKTVDQIKMTSHSSSYWSPKTLFEFKLICTVKLPADCDETSSAIIITEFLLIIQALKEVLILDF